VACPRLFISVDVEFFYSLKSHGVNETAKHTGISTEYETAYLEIGFAELDEGWKPGCGIAS
jgi:hypothetical protein